MYNVKYSILKKQLKPIEVWSCNPADIPVWTLKEKLRLNIFLATVFSWKNTPSVAYAVDTIGPFRWNASMTNQPYILANYLFDEKVDYNKPQFKQRYEDFFGRYYR